MASTSRNFVRTSLLGSLVAGFLATASKPARADHVTPERALLNHVELPLAAPATEKSFAQSFSDEESPGIDGEGALLNRRIVGRRSGSANSGRDGDAHAAVIDVGARDGAAVLLHHAT